CGETPLHARTRAALVGLGELDTRHDVTAPCDAAEPDRRVEKRETVSRQCHIRSNTEDRLAAACVAREMPDLGFVRHFDLAIPSRQPERPCALDASAEASRRPKPS